MIANDDENVGGDINVSGNEHDNVRNNNSGNNNNSDNDNNDNNFKGDDDQDIENNLALPGCNLTNDDFLTIFQSLSQSQSSKSDHNFTQKMISTLNNNIKDFNVPMEENETEQETFSSYYTENQFVSRFLNMDKSSFSLIHSNIRSMNKNFESLSALLDRFRFNYSIIGLSETWFGEQPSSFFEIPGFHLEVNNRANKIGGGVGLYINSEFTYTTKKDLTYMSECIETLFIEIVFDNRKNIVVGVIYRPPNSCRDDFLVTLENILSSPTLKNKDCFLIGDFNINLFNYNSDPFVNEFSGTLLTSSFTPLISKPTRITEHSSTLIDNIFTNMYPVPEAGIVVSDITDHFPIFTHFKINSKRSQSEIVYKRNFNNENFELLIDNLNNVDWSDLYTMTDVDKTFNEFMTRITFLLNQCIPLRKINSRNKKRIPKSPWITPSLLRAINRKNNLYLKYKAKPSDSLKSKYLNYKNTLSGILRREKKKYFEQQFVSCSKNAKDTWKIINNVLNKQKKKVSVPKIKIDGNLIDNPKDIAESFNEYFVNVGPNLARNIPNCDKKFDDYLTNRNSHAMFFAPALECEILDIVHNFQSKRSCGHDGFDNSTLKKIMPAIVQPFAYICNLSMTSGVFPQKMKLAKIIPVFKKGDTLSITNYRPISLLTVFSKVLEKIVFTRTTKFLEDYDILHESQFGFRKKQNTSHALLNLINKITKSIDDQTHTIGLFLDFSKAFDTIDHTILLSKLTHYGIRGIAHDWYRSYLDERQQFTCIDSCNSKLRNINCGVPQGSILGPLLFIIYINDLHKSSDLLAPIMYADDTNLFFSHKNTDTLCNTVNTELQAVTKWIKANKLSLNLEKTNFMLFSTTLSELPQPIIMDNVQIQKVSKTKFLGTFIDDKLTWKFHVEHVCKTISRNIGMMNKLKYTFPSKVLLSLYSTLVLPYLNYGILAWGNSALYLLDRILLLQKKAMRVISNAHFLDKSDELFHSNKVLKVSDIYKLNTAVLMFQKLNNTLPPSISNMFILNNQIHRYPTRQIDQFHLPRTRTVLTQNTFIYTAPNYWNSLPREIKDLKGLFHLKRKIKKNLLSLYTKNKKKKR